MSTNPKPSARRPSRSELRALVPLRTLSDPSLEFLSDRSHVVRLPKGARVADREGGNAHVLFLIAGEVLVKAPDGSIHQVSGGTTRAHFPLVPQGCQAADFVCRSDIQLLRIPADMIRQVSQLSPARGQPESKPEIKIEEDKLEDQVYIDFHESLKAGTLELPGMPDVATRIARHVESPNATSDSIARIVQADPSVTARLIQVANSPAFGGRSRIESCKDAVTRLGRTTTRDLVTGFVMKGLFKPSSPVIKTHMEELWRHSTEAAALCFALARRTPGFDPSQALLVGLMHDIGMIPLLTNAHRYPALLKNPTLLERILTRLRGDFSAMTLRKWGFGNEFVGAALEAEDWFRNKGTQPDLTDLLIMAQLHFYVGKPRMTALPRINEVPAFRKLALGQLSPRLSLAVLDDAHKEIEEVRQMLG